MTFYGSPFDIYHTRHHLGRFTASCPIMTKDDRLKCHDILGRVTDCMKIRGKWRSSVIEGIYYTVMKDTHPDILRKCNAGLPTLQNIETVILEHIHTKEPLRLLEDHDTDDEQPSRKRKEPEPEEYTIPEWANGDIFWELEPRQRESIFTDDEDDEPLSDRQARLLDNTVLSDLAKTPGCSKCRYLPRGCKKCVKDFTPTRDWKERFPNRASALYIRDLVDDIIKKVIINNQYNL